MACLRFKWDIAVSLDPPSRISIMSQPTSILLLQTTLLHGYKWTVLCHICTFYSWSSETVRKANTQNRQTHLTLSYCEFSVQYYEPHTGFKPSQFNSGSYTIQLRIHYTPMNDFTILHRTWLLLAQYNVSTAKFYLFRSWVGLFNHPWF